MRETIKVRSDQSVVFVVPENLITARGGGRWRSDSLLLYSRTTIVAVVTNLLLRKKLTFS